MFERFQPAARQAVVDARAEAGRAGQDKIRCEHMLLGLLAEPGPAADALAAAGLELADLRSRIPSGKYQSSAALDAEALASLGIDLDAVRRATDAAFGPGALDRVATRTRRRLPFSDDARQSLARALHAAVALHQREISSGHMLIGIIDQQRNEALAVLAEAGVDIASLRADVLRRITEAA